MDTVKEDSVSDYSPVEGSLGPSLMRTDSMDSDSSIDSEKLIDIPVSPDLLVSLHHSSYNLQHRCQQVETMCICCVLASI